MINLSTPTLQIKTSGFNILNIKTMNVSITYPDGVINKGNSDIEINNDVITVFLTQEEADHLKGIGANISISAINQSNIDISDQIKIIWVKKGSRLSSIAGGSFVSEEIFNQTISNINGNIEDLENGLFIGGNRVYLDYQDGKYGINTDPHRGADTFCPFKSDEEIDLIKSPLEIPVKFSGTHAFFTDSQDLDLRSYLPIGIRNLVKKIIIKRMNIKRNNLVKGKGSVSFYFKIYGFKQGEVLESALYSNYWTTLSNYITVNTSYINDAEIDTSLFASVTSFGVYAYGKVSSSAGAKTANYEFSGALEVYF